MSEEKVNRKEPTTEHKDGEPHVRIIELGSDGRTISQREGNLEEMMSRMAGKVTEPDPMAFLISFQPKLHICDTCKGRASCTFSTSAQYFAKHLDDLSQMRALLKCFFNREFVDEMKYDSFLISEGEQPADILISMAVMLGYTLARNHVPPPIVPDLEKSEVATLISLGMVSKMAKGRRSTGSRGLEELLKRMTHQEE